MSQNNSDTDSVTSIPESAQYIDESTLIPASEFIVESESMQQFDIPPAASDAASQAAPTVENTTKRVSKTSTGEQKSGSNTTTLIAAVVGIVVVGVIGMKVMGNNSAEQVQPVQVAPLTAPAPAPKADPAPVPVVMPVADPAPPVVAQNPTQAASEPVNVQAPEVAAISPKAEVATTEEVNVATSAPKENLDKLENGVSVLGTTSKLHGEEIDTIKSRLDKLEAGSSGISKSQGPVNAESSQNNVANKSAFKTRRVYLTAEQREAIAKKKSERAARKAAAKAEQDRITGNARGYQIHSLKDNLVWLKNGNDVKVYSIGDKVPGVGVLTGIDTENRSARIAGRIVR